MQRRLTQFFALFLLALSTLLAGCGLASWMASPEAQMANAVVNGAACGYAAANGTPCTPKEVLAALARDAEAQEAKVKAVLPQAAAVDPALTKAYVAQLEANTRSNQALTEAIVLLAARSAPTPASSTPETPPLPAAPAILPTAPSASSTASSTQAPPPVP